MSQIMESPALPYAEVPLLDLGDWYGGDESARSRLAREAHKICRDIGFMYVANHGIPQRTVDLAFAQAREFFALPEETKSSLRSSHNAFHKGYVPINAEVSDLAAAADLKEALDIGTEWPEVPDASPLAERLSSPNLWPPGHDDIRTALLEYFEAMEQLAATIMELFAIGLDLPADFFATDGEPAVAQMRLIHYPPQTAPKGSSEGIGIGAHRDFEALTILAQDDRGGLEVKNLDGGWLKAPPVDGAFVINIGEMLQRWTNDVFKATEHRVINTSGKERYSIPYFWAPGPSTVVQPVPSCVSEDRPATYPAITVADYMTRRLTEVYGGEERNSR